MTTALMADNGGQNLPDLGNASRTLYSLEEERKLGHQVMVQIRQSRAFVDDPELQAYIQNLGQTLARNAQHGFFQFFLIKDPAINAFALPGGYIGINTGLVTSAENESELAAVLAHEIVHVDQQHWARMMAARKERSGLTAAALLASLVLASSGSQAGEAGIAITTAANMAQELSYSRTHEREADRLGIQLLAKSGFQTDSMAGFFEKLQQSHRLMGSNIPEYLRTHPIETNRIAEARDRARSLRSNSAGNQADFHYAKARIIALFSENARDAGNQLASALSKKSLSAYQYGTAILDMRVNRGDQALRTVQNLRRRFPKDLRFLALEAEINLKFFNKNKGLKLLASANTRSGGKREYMLRQAVALIHYREFELAYVLLKQSRKHPPQYPQIEKLFAQAAGETGRLLEAHRALAEYYFLEGNTAAALQQLTIARTHAKNDQYQLAGIDARRKEIEASQ